MRRLFFLLALAIFHPALQVKAKGDSVHVLYQAGYKHLAITSYETNDTATVVNIRCTLSPGEEFSLPDKPLYLDDEQHRGYRLLATEGITFEGKGRCPFTGILDFKLMFEPLAGDVEIFDLKVAGQSYSWFGFWGIHQSPKTLNKIKPAKERRIEHDEAYIGEGGTTIVGRIEGYTPQATPTTLLLSICNHLDRYDHISSKISEDGTFLMEVPVKRLRWEQIEGLGAPIPVMLVPSDTLYVDVKCRKGLDAYIEYRSAKGYDVSPNLMHADISFLPIDLFFGIRKQKYRPAEFNEEVRSEMKRVEMLSHYLSWKFALSSREARLLHANMQNAIAEVGIDCISMAVREGCFISGKAYSTSQVREKVLSQDVIDAYQFLDFIDTNDYSYFILYQSLFANLKKFHDITECYPGEMIEAYIKQKLNENWKKELGY